MRDTNLPPMSEQMKRIVTPKRLPPGRHSSSVMDHTTPKRTAAKRTDGDNNKKKQPRHRWLPSHLTNIPPPTFGDEGSQKASRRARTESAKQGAAHHRRVGVGASIHHWVSGDKIGGLLCDVGTGATPHDNLDLIHVQVLEISRQHAGANNDANTQKQRYLCGPRVRNGPLYHLTCSLGK